MVFLVCSPGQGNEGSATQFKSKRKSWNNLNLRFTKNPAYNPSQHHEHLYGNSAVGHQNPLMIACLA
jgi:hypothetical protein